MNALKQKEVEFKYNADSISLTDFTSFCLKVGTPTFLMASGYDYFYSKEGCDTFARHRIGPDFNQLTFKRKTTDKNNFVRTEHNLMLKDVTTAQTEALCKEFGYEFNRSIFKNAFIYQYSRHILVYYVVYDEQLKELGRFIEIEMSEDHAWPNEQEAWTELLSLEQDMSSLGISPQRRIKKSLFEQFRRD